MVAIRIQTPSPNRHNLHRAVVVVAETGQMVVLPLAPVLSNSGLAARVETHDRVGDYPLIGKAGNQAHSISGTMILAGRNPFVGWLDRRVHVETELQWLRFFAKTTTRIQFLFMGPSTGGWWVLTDFGWDDNQRTEKNDLAVVTATFTALRATDQGGVELSVSALDGGARGPASNTAGAIVMRPGQSLWQAAHEVYGNGDLWPRIADANGVLPTENLDGRRLIIPRP